MTGRLFIHASNVHQGGGKLLLLQLLGQMNANWEAVLCLDERMTLPVGRIEGLVCRVKPQVVQRFLAELWLRRKVTADDAVLCFGNLPPLFRLRGHVTVFVQNRYLIDKVDLAAFSWKTRLRLVLERIWLRRTLSNANEFVVQTPSMQRLLSAYTDAPVRVLPFIRQHETYTRTLHVDKPGRKPLFDFLYVASGEPHKNHRKLIEAWCILAEEGLFPTLTLTLDKAGFPALCAWLDQKIAQCGLNIITKGALSHEQVLECYAEAGALIFPSTIESFGLPLIEARQAGLPILASELDYVRDAIDPEQTFDPQSAVSIARAVKRHLQHEEAPLPLQGAATFLNHVVERAGYSANSHR